MINLIRLLFIYFFFHLAQGQVRFLGSFGEGKPVYGIININGDLHMIRENTSGVYVFRREENGNLFSEVKRLTLSKKSGYFDMAYLNSTNQLVLLNWDDSKNVTLLNLSSNKEEKFQYTNKNSVSSVTLGLPENSIIITESITNSIKIFNSQMKLLRNFTLRVSRMPRSLIRTPNFYYVGLFGFYMYEPHYLCKFNIQGFVVGRCFGGRPGKGLDQLNVPARMINMEGGGFLLADSRNKRILKISDDFSKSEVLIDESFGLSNPYRLSYDASQKILYVANNDVDPETSLAIRGRVYAFRI